jgi:hypothetical protein
VFFHLRHKEALIDERRDDQNDRDTDEVELIQTAEIVQEKFREPRRA